MKAGGKFALSHKLVLQGRKYLINVHCRARRGHRDHDLIAISGPSNGTKEPQGGREGEEAR
jgi:hypothetical protein